MSKVQRGGTAHTVKDLAKIRKHPCRTAPPAPSGFAVDYFKRDLKGPHFEWAARAKWSPVTADAAGRPLAVDGYEVQLRATNASGVPQEVEYARQAVTGSASTDIFTATAHGFSVNDTVEFTATTGGAGINTGQLYYVIATSLTTDTFKVSATQGGSSINVTSNLTAPSFVRKNDKHDYKSHFEPGHGPGSDEKALFHPLPKPKLYYFQARIRTLSKHKGHRCWSAWSSYTTPTQPATGAIGGTPVPASVALTLDKVEGTEKYPWRARVKWNELSTWVLDDSDTYDGAQAYHVQLQVSNDAGSTIANTRHMHVPAEFGNSTAQADFFNIKGKRAYRARVRAQSPDGNWGAFSSYTSWLSPHSTPKPTAVSGVTITNPSPGRVVGTWSKPTDFTDTHEYHVKVLRGTTIVEESYQRGTKYAYDIPKADRGSNHKIRVSVIDEDIFTDTDAGGTGTVVADESSTVDSSLLADTETWDVTDLTDGAVPSSSPAATVKSAIGALVVTWPAVSNPDPIEYEVHVSTSSGFTPTAGSATTLAGIAAGTGPFWIRKLPNGGLPLEFGTTYYVRIISRDKDGPNGTPGTVGSSTIAQATSGDIAVGAITADQILAGAVTAEKLQSDLVLANTIFGGDPANQHVEIDSAGVRLVAADGTPLVDLPTDETKDAVFTGEIIARAITVIQAATIRGLLTLDRGASMRFSSNIVDPDSKPTLSITRDFLDYAKQSTGYTLIKRQGFWYDPSGSGAQPTVFYTDVYFQFGVFYLYIIESKQSDGTKVRSKLISQGTNLEAMGTLNGVVRVGSIVYLLAQDSAGVYISRWNQSDLSATGAGTVTINANLEDMVTPSLTYDGTNLCIVDSDGAGVDTIVTKYTAANPPVFVSKTTISGLDAGNGGMAVGESKWWFGGNVYGSTVAAGEDTIRRTSTAGVRGTTDDDFEAPAGYGDCIGHDGTQFWTGSRVSTRAYKHTNWTWTPSQSSQLWVGHTWYDQNATGGTHETAISPRASIVMAKRAKLQVSTPTLPGAGGTDDPNRVRVYANWGAAEPTGGSPTRFSGYLQVEDALMTRVLSTIDLTGTPPENPGTNSFATGGSESSLQSHTGVPLLRSNGIPRAKVKNGGGVSATDGSLTTITVANEDADTDGFWDGSSNYVVFPYDGQYQVLCQLSFAVNSNGRRGLELQTAPSPYTTWTNVGADATAYAAPVGTDRSTVQVATILDMTATTGMRVRAFQNSGGGALNCQMRMSILYLGPT